MRLLPGEGADRSKYYGDGHPVWATAKRHGLAGKLLIEKGADARFVEYHYKTLLLGAAREPIVELVVRKMPSQSARISYL